MTIKQEINHAAIQKVCDLLHGIFDSIHPCNALSISFDHLHCVIKNNKLQNEKKYFLHI